MKKTIAWLLSLVLLLSCVTPAMAAELSSPETSSSTQKTEVLSKRDAYSKTYILPDGSFQFVGYAEPIHYQDSTGSYVEINNKITDAPKAEGYKYTNTSNAWHAYFSDDLSNNNAVMMTSEKYNIAFSFIGPTGVSSVTKATDISLKDSRGTLTAYHQTLATDNRAVIYSNVVDNVDIAYTVQTGVLKEDIIIKAKQAPNSFKFRLNTNGLVLKESNDAVALFTTSGQEAFRFAPLYMEDANGKRSENVSLTYTSAKNGYELTITADTEFLNAADTVYPVVIDPSVMVTGENVTYDTCVDQEYPTSNYYLSENLWTGGALGTNAMRTYMKFTMPSGISASQVTSAYVYLLKREHQAPTIKAYRVTSSWSSRAVTWNSKPSFSNSDYSGSATNTVGAWYGLNVTTMVKNWLNGTYSNYGMVLKEPSETNSSQKTKFYSSDAPSPNKPELEINYNASNNDNENTNPLITYYYNLYRNSDMSTASSAISTYVTQASLDIQNMYNVSFAQSIFISTSELNQQSGCTLSKNEICSSDDGCGFDFRCEAKHHKSASHFLYSVQTNSNNTIISFVDYALCYYDTAKGHRQVYGLKSGTENRIIVSLFSYNVQRTTCHEMSHLIGARDEVCTPNQQCVMRYNSNVTNVWCDQCKSDILAYLDSL